MTSTPANTPADQPATAPADGAVPVPSGQTSEEALHVVDTVEVVETNQPLDEWGED